jgi:hypothetical protein
MQIELTDIVIGMRGISSGVRRNWLIIGASPTQGSFRRIASEFDSSRLVDLPRICLKTLCESLVA